MLRARDIMVPNPVTISCSATVYEGIKLMANKNIASLIVVDDSGRVLGIVTAKDIVIKVLAKNLDPRAVTMSDIISTPVTIVEPETPLKTIVNMMVGTGHGHIPVVDKSGKPIGIVTVDDVLKLLPELLESIEIVHRKESKS